MAQKRRLPKDYQELDYIEGDKTSYINIPSITIQTTDEIYAEFYLKHNGNRMFGVNGLTRCYVAAAGGGTSSFCGKSKSVPVAIWHVGDDVLNTVKMTASSIVVNDTAYAWESGTLADQELTNFRINNIRDGTSGTTTNVSSMKTFYIKKQDGSYRVNLVMGKNRNTNVLGMYDLTWDGSQYGCVDMSTLAWNPIGSGGFYAVVTGKANGRNIYCTKYETDQTSMASATRDMHIGGHDGNRVYFRNTSIENTRAAAQADLAGIMLYYQRTDDPSWASPWYTNSGTGTFTAGPAVQTYDLVPESKKGVVFTSKNLFDPANKKYDGVSISSSSGQKQTGSNRCINVFGWLEAGNYIICSTTDTIGGYLHKYSEEGTESSFSGWIDAISLPSSTQSGGLYCKTFALTERCYCRGVNSASLVNTGNIMLIEGDTLPTSYIPYGQLLAPLSKNAVFSARLPEGYTELEYVESSGTQYINTGVSGEVRIAGKGQGTALVSTSSLIVSSTGQGTGGTFFGTVGTETHIGFGVKASTGLSSTLFLDEAEFDLNFVDNGTDTGTVNGESISRTHAATQETWYIFGLGVYLSRYKLQYLRMYQNDTLVRNFIPAKNSSNVVGMYDLVTNQFFTNAGTGTFTAGPEVNHIYPTTRQLTYITYD